MVLDQLECQINIDNYCKYTLESRIAQKESKGGSEYQNIDSY